ncbi:MAG TPA: hemerythrin domain-containing protein [Polyangia bacterium]|jgi:hemerythrin-like domain-containing protein
MARDPFEMLERCHRRLEETLATLGGATPARQALDEALAFIDRAMARHERDEEESLFPRLARVPQLAPLLDRLTVQHRDQAALVDELRALMDAPRPDEARLADVVARLDAAYRAHLAIEERELFPAAKAALDADDIGGMASEMDARRRTP